MSGNVRTVETEKKISITRRKFISFFFMKAKKNWYTLLELMIVLWIIIILMTVTMRFSSSHLDNLQTQTSKDDFKNNYEQLLLTNMSSNYYNKDRYEKIEISMILWLNWFTYKLINEEEEQKIYTWYSNPKIEIIKLIVNNNEANEIITELIPYQIACKINNNTWTAKIEIKAKNKSSCFQYETNTCKIKNINCLDLYPKE